MALEFKDRVKDQTNTTGTGAITVDGIAPTGYRTITSAHTTGSTLRYTIISADGTQWEVGEGVWTSSNNTLTRVTVYASSNAGSLVSFSAGAKTVFTGPTAADRNGTIDTNLAFSGTGLRVTGDFSNATASNRVLVQTSSANSQTLFGLIPSGTSQNAQFQAYNSSDPNNASVGTFTAASGTIRIVSGNTGTGTLLPLVFVMSATEVARLDTSGNLGLGVAPSAWSTTSSVLENPSGSIYTFSGTNQIGLNSNAYYNGTNWIYRNASSVGASDFFQQNGFFVWRNATAGTAGNTISYSERMRLDASGNLGLGVTPSAWKSDWNALDIETGGIAIAGALASGAVATNAFLNSSAQWIYKSSFAATLYETTSTGQHRWFNAPSGTAGNAISFTQAMTLDGAGRLAVGGTASTYKLEVFNSDASIYDVRVGRGAGGHSLNTAVGNGAIFSNSSGIALTAVGVNALLANTTASYNTAVGRIALTSVTTGGFNTAVGANAAYQTTTGLNNVGVGYGTLAANVTGSYAVAVGASAGSSATAGGGVFIGHATGAATTSAVGVTFVGGNYATYNAANNTTGSFNSAFGSDAFASNTTGSNNTAIGFQSLYSNTTATNNTAVGHQSSHLGTTADFNVAVGTAALYSNTTGVRNTAIGPIAMRDGPSTSDNVAVGYAALLNTSGSSNVAVGSSCLQASTSSSGHVAVGAGALRFNTTGTSNTAVGSAALYLNTTGGYKTAVGTSALYNSTSSFSTAVGYAAGLATTTGTITAVGYLALTANTTGGSNTAVGTNALYNNTTGSQSVAVGESALGANTTASNNTAVGYAALSANTTGDQNTAVGGLALSQNTTGIYNTAVGLNALYANTTGVYNTAVGRVALGVNTTGYENSAFGINSLASTTTGRSNTALGAFALQANTTASYNTAVGAFAAYSNTTGSIDAYGFQAGNNNTTGVGNLAVGKYALSLNTTGSANTAIGSDNPGSTYGAMYSNTTGAYNTAIGNAALYNNTTANSNVAIGYQSAYSNSTGTNNTAIGTQALYNNSTGSYNIAIGTLALYSNTTASSNTVIGHQAGYSGAAGSANNTFVGYQAGYATVTNGSNTFVGYLSGSAVTTGYYHTIIGAFDGNSSGLDIRTANRYIVLADGAGTPRGIFTSNGSFLVGTTNSSGTAGSGLKVLPVENGTGNPQVAIVTGASSNTTSSLALYSTGAAAYRFYVADGGTIYATSTTISAISDQRLKENIRDLDDGLSAVMALKPRKFDWKAGKGKDIKGDRGFIAQELETVFPDLIDEWKDPAPEGEEPYKAVRADLIPVLVKAIQELKAEVDNLKSQLNGA